MRLTRRSRTMIIALAVALLLAGFVTLRIVQRSGTTFSALFDSTVGLYPGSDVQVLGVPVGTVTKVEPTDTKVRVTMRLDRGQAVAADTNAVIVAPTLVSDRFVQLTTPYTDGKAKLPDGATLSNDRTAVPVEIDDLYASLTDVAEKLGPNGANQNGALSDFLDVAAKNLDGQGANINRVISEFGKASGTLADVDDDLFATIANFKEFNDMLVANDRGVADVNRQFAAVTRYLADDSDDLSAAVDNLGDALAIVDDFIRDNRGQLKTSVEKLRGPTQVLVQQKKSLEESVRLVPLVLQNFLRAYNPTTQTLDGRGNLNELTLWPAGSGVTSSSSAAKKKDAEKPSLPPLLLPGVDQ